MWLARLFFCLNSVSFVCCKLWIDRLAFGSLFYYYYLSILFGSQREMHLLCRCGCCFLIALCVFLILCLALCLSGEGRGKLLVFGVFGADTKNTILKYENSKSMWSQKEIIQRPWPKAWSKKKSSQLFLRFFIIFALTTKRLQQHIPYGNDHHVNDFGLRLRPHHHHHHHLGWAGYPAAPLRPPPTPLYIVCRIVSLT